MMDEKTSNIFNNSNIKFGKKVLHKLQINFDQVDFDIIEITRDGKTIFFPTWEFLQILERMNDGI